MRTFKEWLLLQEGDDLALRVEERFKGFQPLLAKFGIQASKLEAIGRGDKGTAFSDGTKVVKITEDAKEARASANIVGKNLAGVNKIHFVGQLDKEFAYQEPSDDYPIETQYYVIIQDLLNTSLTDDEESAVDGIEGYLSDKAPNQKEMVSNWSPEDFREKLQQYEGSGFFDEPQNATVAKQVFQGLKSLNDLGITFFDIQPANMGKDGSGNITLFDLGISESPPINIPKIS